MENEKLLPPGEPSLPPGVPSRAAQSWGAVVSITVIVLMIIIGAFYSWGNRIAQERALDFPATAQ